MDLLTPEQEQTLQRLKEQDVFFHAVQNAFNHIIITNSDGVILYANQATQRITGHAQQDIIGKTPKLWGGQMRPEFYQKLWKTIKEERRPFIGEVINHRKNGEQYRAHVIISPIPNGGEGTLLGFIGTEEEISSAL